jgi:uncharacterized protein (TIGR02186 family)
MRYLLLFLLVVPYPAYAQALLADLSSHIIAVRTDFKGADVLLFGSLDQPLQKDDNLIITVQGPTATVRMRERHRRYGLWLSGNAVDLHGVPQFFSILSAAPYSNLPESVKAQYNFGLDVLRFNSTSGLNDSDLAVYHNGLIEKYSSSRLYREQQGSISFLGERLFRVNIPFPQSVPVGSYQVMVYVLHGSEVIAAQSSSLLISKDGLGADIAFLAKKYSFLYAFLCLSLALGAGWAGFTVFKRMR